MTKAEMRAEVFRRLHEVATAPVFWTVADVDAALDAGYAELADATEWYEQSLEIDLLNARPFYDLRTIIGPDFLAIRPIFDEQTNRWLVPAAVRHLDDRDRRWERVNGEPQRFFMRGLWWLGLFPRLGLDAGLVKVAYTALPPPLAEDDDEPGFPENFHDGCILFALTDLWAQDAETRFALAAWTAYLEVEAALASWVDERASAPQHHGFRGGSVPT